MYKLVVQMYFLFSSVSSMASSLSQKINSLPEFECTLIQINNNVNSENFYDLTVGKSLSLRSTQKKWYFDLAKNSYILKADKVVKKTDILISQSEYLINFKDNLKITLSLKGQSPSRNGELRLIKGPQDFLLGKVTCH